MNNEPVAWMYQIHDITGWTWVFSQSLPDYEYRNEKPLYTHPVKELTDEEIYQTWVEAKNTALNTRGSDFVEVIFARAILRKASEK